MRNNIAAVSSPISSDAPSRWASFCKLFQATLRRLFLRKPRLLREGIDVKFGFIAKHRGIWPAGWLCEALGVSRGGVYAWLTRPRSQRNRTDEELGAKGRASFVASDRTYGARRGWKNILGEGLSCGL